MNKFILGLFADAGLPGLLFLWGIIVVGPILLINSAVAAFKDKKRERGTIFLFFSFTATLLVIAFLIKYGRVAAVISMKSAGGWIIGISTAAIVCTLAYPICLLGSQLRLAFLTKAKQPLIISMAGLVTVGALLLTVFHYAPIKATLGIAIIIVLAIILGWVGKFLIPDLEG
jgi:hypothetical protein